MDTTTEFYANASSSVEQSFSEVYLEAGTVSIKFTCIGKHANSSNFVGSFDKLIISSRPSTPTAVEESEMKDEISIYPNPVKNMLYVNGIDGPTELSIYNSTGVQVIKTSSAGKVDLSRLLKGVYLLKIDNEVFKIIKQ